MRRGVPILLRWAYRALPQRKRGCAPFSAWVTSDLGRCRKTPDRIVFRVVGLEAGQQLRDRKQIGSAFGQVQQFEAAALAADSSIGANDFAEARAVDV